MLSSPGADIILDYLNFWGLSALPSCIRFLCILWNQFCISFSQQYFI